MSGSFFKTHTNNNGSIEEKRIVLEYVCKNNLLIRIFSVAYHPQWHTNLSYYTGIKWGCAVEN